jgi:putative ABC transport system substrate-binding protein
MRRRLLLQLIALGAFPALPARAQQAASPRRIGFFYGGSRWSSRDTGRYQAFLQGMREAGYTEGQDFTVIERYSEDSALALERAKELLSEKPDVVVVSGGISLQALQKLGVKIPVVVAVSADPVRQGIADTPARPGRNFTGFSAALQEVFPRHVPLIKSAVPGITRLAVLSNPRNREHAAIERTVADAAYENGMRVQVMRVGAAVELDAAFAEVEQHKSEALLILGESFYVQHFREIAALCIRCQMISSYSGREYPEAGGFMSYGPNFREHYRGSARLVDKILKGARPAELPFEQLTKAELVLNSRTAKALGLEIPEQLLLRADAVID